MNARAYDSDCLPQGLRARMIEGVNGLTMHVLEAGFETPGRPVMLLLHGFPEIAFSWRKIMRPLAEAGFHVVAPDQRGYGRTSEGPVDYDADLSPYRILNLVRDMVALTSVLGFDVVPIVVGHDYGASIAAACALVRPDLFKSVVIMSAPFTGAPRWPLGATPAEDKIHAALAALDRPRKHYHAYFATRAANADMWASPDEVHEFLRAYFHFKSADWSGNEPFELAGWTADELAKMPDYYVMPRDLGMAEAVAPYHPKNDADCAWLTEAELRVYSGEYARTGFQGGLQWYRTRMNGMLAHDLALFAGATIDCPSLFIAGRSDWGAHQVPNGLRTMRNGAFTRMPEPCFIQGAGHWVQQERAEEVVARLKGFAQAL